MPGMGGRELVEHLATIRPATPVLYISGYADSSALGGVLRKPAVGLLHKPFTAEVLVGRVRDILDGSMSA
jgi:FixJ family two-component response regulator